MPEVFGSAKMRLGSEKEKTRRPREKAITVGIELPRKVFARAGEVFLNGAREMFQMIIRW